MSQYEAPLSVVVGRRVLYPHDEILNWLDDRSTPGYYCYKLSVTETGARFFTTFYLSDPDTAFEMRLRYGAEQI